MAAALEEHRVRLLPVRRTGIHEECPALQREDADSPQRSSRIDAMLSLLGLFLAAFVAATLIPAQSEAVLVMLLVGGGNAWVLVAVATVGNVLGSLVNWWLGRQVLRFQGRKWFPVSPARLGQAQSWYRRYGRWSLLLSWAPVIGDPITLAAGVMRERLRVFVPLVVLAKGGRYAVLALATLGMM